MIDYVSMIKLKYTKNIRCHKCATIIGKIFSTNRKKIRRPSASPCSVHSTHLRAKEVFMNLFLKKTNSSVPFEEININA